MGAASAGRRDVLVGAEWGYGELVHRNEREGAARVDRDAMRVVEPGAGAGAIGGAGTPGAGERGGRPGGDVDAANALVVIIL